MSPQPAPPRVFQGSGRVQAGAGVARALPESGKAFVKGSVRWVTLTFARNLFHAEVWRAQIGQDFASKEEPQTLVADEKGVLFRTGNHNG